MCQEVDNGSGNQSLIQLLKDEMRYRKYNNERYSLRAFARDLHLSPSRLSEILNGKGKPSKRTIKGVLERLHFEPREIDFFCSNPSLPRKDEKSYHLLSNDEFKIIADWQHFAILTAMRLDNFDGKASWLADCLGISLPMTLDSLNRLEKVSVVARNDDNSYALLKENVETSDGIPSTALKLSHKQILRLAAESLDRVPVHERDVSSITMAIDIKKLPKARRFIKKFRRNLCELLESDEKNSVYNLNIQLHPLRKEKI